MYFWAKRNDVPFVLKGYRIGADNVVYSGKWADSVILHNIDLSRHCSVDITTTMRSSKEVWLSGSVYSVKLSEEAIRLGEAQTPGEFYFSINVPPNAPVGDAFLIANAEFVCPDNPFMTRDRPAKLSAVFPIRVED